MVSKVFFNYYLIVVRIVFYKTANFLCSKHKTVTDLVNYFALEWYMVLID